jgi:hypothetical protein
VRLSGSSSSSVFPSIPNIFSPIPQPDGRYHEVLVLDDLSTGRAENLEAVAGILDSR